MQYGQRRWPCCRADDSDLLADLNRLAQIDCLEKIKTMIHAGHVLAGNVGLAAELSAGGNIDSVELLVQLVKAHIFAHGGIQMDLHTGGFDCLNVPVEHSLGQTVLRNTVGQDAAGNTLRLENLNGIATQLQVICTAQAAGAGADNGNFLSVGFALLFHNRHAVFESLVCDKTLDVADTHGFIQAVSVACCLAGMVADSAAYRGEGVGLTNKAVCILISAGTCQSDIALNIRSGRTCSAAGRYIPRHYSGSNFDCIGGAMAFTVFAANAFALIHTCYSFYDLHCFSPFNF